MRWWIGVTAALAAAGCGGTSAAHKHASIPHKHASIPFHRVRGPARVDRPPPEALVTAETENRLLVFDLPGGRLAGSVALAADPENVAVGSDVVVVVSPRSAKVTPLDRRTLRVLRVLGGFGSPHIPAISPGGQFAYVTDDARGTLTAIDLRTLRATSTIAVGAGAHHIAFSPDGRRAWVALGESASTIAILDTSDLAQPRLIGEFAPGFAVHDLAFSPSGSQIWITSASGPDVSAFSAGDRRLLFEVPVGAGPQHLVFAGAFAFLSSGYGGVIEKVLAATGAIVARAHSPYGSFELDAGGGLIATSSLLRGTLAIYSSTLRLLHLVTVAPAARDVAISAP